jgi:hypothetical protein
VMLYGKRYREIPAGRFGEHLLTKVHVTVTGSVTTIKQGDDLIRLSWGQLEALADALPNEMLELIDDPINQRHNPSNKPA